MKLIALVLGAAAIVAMPAKAQTNTNTNSFTNVITCDFRALITAVSNLDVSDIQAPNNHARQGRLGSLENAVSDATNAAAHGDLSDLLDALDHIAAKTGTNKNSWVTNTDAAAVRVALSNLLNCVSGYVQSGEGDDDDDDGGVPVTGCFDEIAKRNGQTVTLLTGTYDCDLTLRGNRNLVVGSTNGVSIIDGNVLITGNGNVLSNVTVTGTITLRGNNNRLGSVSNTNNVIVTGKNNQY